MFCKNKITLEFLGKFNFERTKLNEQKKKLEKKINQTEQKIETKSKTKEEKELDNLIEEFLKLEKIDKIYLYRLINKIEIDKDKNIYIYFNFSKLNSINENFTNCYEQSKLQLVNACSLDEFIRVEELINKENLLAKSPNLKKYCKFM